MQILIGISRTLVGSLFIVSGLIKANDALGFMYKLEEYFEPGALNLPGLMEYALPIGIFVCIGEILLGVAMLLGALPKLTASLTAVILGFFAWLTWYTANCDPFGFKMIEDAAGVLVEIPNQCVLACGCFGNAIPLTPYESFIKDIVLIVLSIPMFIGALTNRIQLNDRKSGMIILTASLVIIYLFSEIMLDWLFPVLYAAVSFAVAEGIKRRATGNGREWWMALGALAVGMSFQVWTLLHLPTKDYRPYAVGQSIVENMKSAEDLGLDPPKYATEYTFKNKATGADTIVLSTDWLKIYNEDWFKQTYEQVSFDGREIKISEGYEPLIMDFQIIDAEGEDLTEDFLNRENYLLLHISKDLDATDAAGQEALNALAVSAQAAGWEMMALTNATAEQGLAFKSEHQVPYDFYTCDQTELKIVVRSNPGLVLVKQGEVLAKWAWRDFPSSVEEIDVR